MWEVVQDGLTMPKNQVMLFAIEKKINRKITLPYASYNNQQQRWFSQGLEEYR